MLPPIMTTHAALVVALVAGFGSSALAAPDLTLERTFVVDGGVNAVASDGTTLYLGGTFTSIGQRSGQLALVNATTGVRDKSIDELGGGQVLALASDGHGGYFVGGDIRRAGALRVRGLAHLTAAGTYDPNFHPVANGFVRSLAVAGTTLYVAGDFSTIAGQPRTRIAAFDLTTGALTSFAPAINNIVYSLSVSGSELYVGGIYSAIDGQPRSGIARFDLPSGALSSWNPNSRPHGTIEAVVATGSTVYLGGIFTQIGSASAPVRNNLAAVDTSTGALLPFDPNVVGNVTTLSLSGQILYVGGTVTSIGGQARDGAGSVNAATGAVTSFAPAMGGSSAGFYVTPTTVYLAGGVPRAMAVDPTIGARQTTWSPALGSGANVIAPYGTGILIGGGFTAINVQPRQNLAAIDLTTGRATDWKPRCSSDVFALALVGSTIYVGGSFSNLTGQPRKNLGAVTTAGTLLPFRADTDDEVLAIASLNSRIFIGGRFEAVSGVVRSRLASLDPITGAVGAWDPKADQEVDHMVAAAGKLYVAGFFSGFGSESRLHLAELDPTTGKPGPDFGLPLQDTAVDSLAANGSTLFVGGQFTTILGVARDNLAAVDLTTHTVTSFTAPGLPEFDAPTSLAASASTVYAGLDQLSNTMFAFDRASGATDSFAQKPDLGPEAMLLLPGRLVIAGWFHAVDGIAQSGVAVYMGTP